jgi:nucleoside-diphosphate-sugar epimerase
MKVLVLGASGYIGQRLVQRLADSGWAEPLAASRSAPTGVRSVRLDATDADALEQALRGVDAVVNCVAGSAGAITGGAVALVQAARRSGCRNIIHFSSMSVYGELEGEVAEDAARDSSTGWYALAKNHAEDALAGFAAGGGSVVVLRPGCVWGPGSELWVGRIARLLQAHRLGDLGAAGDGWSNLVHVDDVCSAALAGLRHSPAAGTLQAYNLSAPDSPRWNDYFVDLALGIGAVPVATIGRRQLLIDTRVAAPPLKVLELACRRAGVEPRHLPAVFPPGLLSLFGRQLRLRTERAERELGMVSWTSYAKGLEQAVQWWTATRRPAGEEAQLAAPR